MKMVIFRVDDRLIHGQVIEGWIKNFHIPQVLIANNSVRNNAVQQMILQSVVPPKTTLNFLSLDELKSDWDAFSKRKQILVLFESIFDLMLCDSLINNNTYVNIGCVASREHSISLTDTVFLEPDEIKYLQELANRWEVHVKKLPWDRDANILGKLP
ncbi:MAG: PTS sugar transporter subunit IIB [Deferribacteraceae bacterium]|jgi:mannose/fructose/N-acetylgalactosamine-specific phosphotransferase system component IIB|nr:PTS sugar transporter subunit IIB [Deferribacteraceae bacterium]